MINKLIPGFSDFEDLFNLVMQNARDMISIHDLDGSFLYVSLSCKSLLGYEQPELTGHSVYEFFYKKDFERIKKYHENLRMNTQVEAIEYRFRKKDRSFVWVECMAKLFKDEKGEGKILAITRDISERRKIAEALREEERKYRQVVDLQSEFICHFLPDSTITFVNEALAGFVEINKEDLIGKKVFDLVDEGYKKQMINNLNKISNIRDYARHEQCLSLPNGSSRWIQWINRGIFDEQGNILSYQGVGRDVTVEKEARIALEKIEWMLRDRKPEKETFSQFYGDLVELNKSGLILKSIGRDMLEEIAYDYLRLLNTSSAIYEKNGDYACGIFSSGWCRLLDGASRKLCNTENNRKALHSGKWLCHESCWTDVSKKAIEKGKPVEKGCHGGLKIFAVPIKSDGNIIGAINFAYGDPPSGIDTLRKISEKYKLSLDELQANAKSYESRPPFIIELAKERLYSSARLIGEIVERKRIEEKLSLIQFAVDRTRDTVFLIGSEARFVYVNDASCENLGYSREEFLNMTVHDIDPDFPKSLWPEHWKELKEKKFFLFESRHRTKEGKVFPVEILVNYVTFHGKEYNFAFARDITDRKAMEDEIFSEKERLLVTLKSIGDGVIATDISGKIILMNKVAEELTGWAFEEAGEKAISGVFNIINEFTGEKCESPVDVVLKTGESTELANHTVLVSRKEEKFLIADSAAPIKDRNNNILGAVLVFRDITEKQRMLDHLEKVHKLDALGLLAGGIAHNFNNLLGGIFGYIELAELSSDDKEVKGYLSQALAVSRRAKGITHQLLTFAKGGDPLREKVAIKTFIEDIVQFILTGYDTAVLFDMKEDLGQSEIDKNQISLAVNNIIMNACQAMSSGGKVILSGENVSFSAGEHVSLKEGKYIKISIRDEGEGISSEILPRVFDPFFTTRKDGQGLGLSVAHSIISKHDGFIDVISKEGEGSTFILYLPSSEKESPGFSVEKSKLQKEVGTVLVMDDEPFLRDVMGQLLRKIGYIPVMTKNSQEALQAFEKAEKEGSPFSIVLLDLTIPGGKGGKELVKDLINIRPSLKAVAISGYSDDPVIARPKDFGFIGSLKKPFTKKELSAALSEI